MSYAADYRVDGTRKMNEKKDKSEKWAGFIYSLSHTLRRCTDVYSTWKSRYAVRLAQWTVRGNSRLMNSASPRTCYLARMSHWQRRFSRARRQWRTLMPFQLIEHATVHVPTVRVALVMASFIVVINQHRPAWVLPLRTIELYTFGQRVRARRRLTVLDPLHHQRPAGGRILESSRSAIKLRRRGRDAPWVFRSFVSGKVRGAHANPSLRTVK